MISSKYLYLINLFIRIDINISLLRGSKGKILKIKNVLNIPEVFEYTYLGIIIDQSLKFNNEC